MVGGVETRTLEDDAHRLIQFAQLFLAALWTSSERLVAELLLSIELHSAALTPVGVKGHQIPPNKG